ncbi:hypothetical protein [Henriciella algicola]|nr:hypothetical protein [Henriciella algicola]
MADANATLPCRYIGLRAKAVALAVFFELSTPTEPDSKVGRRSGSVKDLVDRTRARFPEETNLRWPDTRTEDQVVQFFRRSRQVSAIPEPRARSILDHVARTVAEVLDISASDIRDVLNKDYIRPSEILNALESLRSSGEIERTLGISLASKFSPEFQGPAHSGSGAAAQVLQDLTHDLRTAGPGKRIIGLVAPRFGGKTSLLISLMQAADINPRYSGSQDPRQFFIRAEHSRNLPVFAKDCNHADFHELLTSMLGFLSGDRLPGGEVRLSVNDQLARIRSLSEGHPALYVFGNLDDFGDGSIRLSVRNAGLLRLIDLLVKANEDNIVIYSCQQTLVQHLQDESLLPGATRIIERQLPEQTLEDVLAIGSEAARAILTEELIGSDRKISVSGQTLCLLAVAADFGLEGVKLREGLDAFRTSVRVGRRSEAEQALEWLCWEEMRQSVSPNTVLLWILALTAASDDGLSETSILGFAQVLKSRGHISEIEDPLGALDSFIKDTHGRVIYSVRDQSLEDCEKDTVEKEAFALAGTRFARRYVMDIALSDSLVTFLQDRFPSLFRTVSALISIRARERAQLSKLQIKSIYGTDRSHYRRDVQAYCHLLSSIDATKVTIHAASDDETSSIVEEEVFSIDRSCAPAEVLRYAYFRILRKDIDRSNRMTMVLDDDTTRLQLYLQLFFVGEPFSSRIVAASQLPARIPDYLRKAFSAQDIASVLVSIALSAFFSNRFDIVLRAARLADGLVEAQADKSGLDQLRSQFMRVWCAELDALFLLCRTLETAKISWTPVEERLEALKAECEQISDPKLKRLALQRLRFHEVRLSHYCRDRDSTLRLVEDSLTRAAEINRSTSTSSGALSGRNVRILIKALLGDPLFDWADGISDPDIRRKAVRQAKSLLAHNIARLSRFSGGDRVAVLIDAALIELADANPMAAYDFITQADDSIHYPDLSHSLRLDLLWHKAQIFTALGEGLCEVPYGRLGIDSAGLLDEALLAADQLHELSGENYPFHSALASCAKDKIRRALYPGQSAPDTLAAASSLFQKLGVKTKVGRAHADQGSK